MVRVGGDTSDAEAKLAGLSSKIDGFAGKAGRSGAAMSAVFTAPIVAAGAAVFGLGSSFESAFTGVVKTVDAPRAVIQGLRQDILDMSREIPVGANAIADVMAAGGQLGIATENLNDFTRTMLDLGEATNLTSIQAAQDLARFANITQMPQEQFDNLGSSVVALGNNMATTEADIVGFSMRLAGAGRQVGMSEADILGIAAAYSSVGVEAEAGGTAASRVLIEMATATATHSAELEGFAQTAGLSVAEFERLFEEDAAGALVAFTEGLGRMSAEGENVFGVLEDLGLGEIRVRDALLRSAGAGDLMRRALTLSNEAWAENNALTKEAETRYATVGSQVGKIVNRLRLTGITLYDNVRPQLEDTLGSVAGFADGLVGMAEALGRVDPALISAALAFGAVLAAAGPVMLAVSGVAKAVALLSGPVGWVTLGVAALAAAFASDFMGIRTTTSNAINALRPHFETLMGWIGAASKGDWRPLREGLGGALAAVDATIQSFSWDAYITALSWADWLTTIDWTHFISNLLWSAYLASFAWGDYVSDLLWSAYVWALDWSPYIAKLLWGAYVKSLAWGDHIEKFLWSAYVWTLAWENYISNLTWGDFVVTLTGWGTYISSLTWGDFVTTLSSWGAYIPKINWSHLVSHVVWSAYIGTLDWNKQVKALTWGLYIKSLEWAPFVSKLAWNFYVFSLTWSDYVADLLWDTYVTAVNLEGKVTKLTWGDYVDGAVKWHAYISALSWNAFVKSFLWATYIPRLVWSEFVKALTWENILKTTIAWGDFVPKLQWGLLVTSPLWPGLIAALVWERVIKPIIWGDFIKNLTWESVLKTTISWADFVPRVPWTAIIASPAWPALVSVLAWDKVIKPLVWDGIVGAVDWGKHIAHLWWSEFVTYADLPAWVEDFSWSSFVENLTWPTAITDFSWAEFIPDLTWPDFMQAFRDWLSGKSAPTVPSGPQGAPVQPALPELGGTVPASYYGGLELEVEVLPTYLPPAAPPTVDVKIGMLDTSGVAQSLELPLSLRPQTQPQTLDTSGIQSAVDQLNAFAFTWPEYPAWEWPPITIPDWPDVPRPSWVWQSIPSPSWLSRLTVPRPSWLGELLTWSPTVTVTGGGAAALAEGTPRWGGGLALVGERGPELINLPRGAAVYPSDATEAMLAGAGGVNVTIHAAVNNDLDMEVLAQRVADAIRRRGR